MSALLQPLQTLSVLVFLIGSMGAIGLASSAQAVAAPLRSGRFVLLALVLNFAVAPSVAWLLTCVIPLAPPHAAGLLLLGGAAGAPFLPKLVEASRGDLAPAAALMLLLTAGTMLFLPFVAPLMISGLSADPWRIARPLLMLIVLPLGAGMVIRRHAGTFASRAAPVLARLGNAGLLVLFVLLVALNGRALLAVLGSGAILAALIFFTVLFACGWLAGGAQREVLGLATAARNFGAALVPAANSAEGTEVLVMIIVGAIVCLGVTFVAARWVWAEPRRRGRYRTKVR